jgi:hypothetical protein
MAASLPSAEELRRKAAECRRAAEEFQDRFTRARMLEMAGDYERMAQRVEALVGADGRT